MTEIIKGASGQNRYLIMTEQDARQKMNCEPNLNFYRCEQLGEFDSVIRTLPIRPKIELCHKLQIGAWTYDSFLLDQFKASIIQMYHTGLSHYTAPDNIITENDESIFYLAPAIYGLEYPGIKYYNLTYNQEVSKQYVERFKLDEMKAQQLITSFYRNTGTMYKDGAPMFSLPKHYENHLIKMLVEGEAIIIEKAKSLFAPFEEVISSAVGVCVLKSNQIDETCQPIEVFIIKCDHFGKGRNFQLDVINNEPNFNGSQHVIQVVAQSDKPETVTIEYDKPACTNGDSECPSITINSTDKAYGNQVITSKPYNISVVPNTSDLFEDSSGNPVINLVKFISEVFIPSNSITKPNIYTVKTQGCNDIKGSTAEVHCYPTMGWTGEITAGRTAEREEKFNFEYDKNDQLKTAALPLDAKSGFSYGGEFLLDINGRKFQPIKYSRSEEGESNNFILKRIEDTVSGLLDSIDLISKIGEKIGVTPAKFTIKPPNIALGGEMKAVEHPSSGVIDYEGSIYLKAKPLMSLDIEIDFLNILIILAGGATTAVGGPAAAKFIIEMRKKFSTGIGDENSTAELKGDFYAKLTIKGSAGGSLIWNSKPGEKTAIEQGIEESDELDEENKRISYTKGELTGKVGITIEAGAHIEGRLFKISVKAGVGIGASGATGIGDPVGLFITLAASSEKNKPTLSGNVEFSGIQIYYIKFAEMSRKEGVSTDGSDRKVGRAGGFAKKIDRTEHKLDEAKTLYTMIEPKKLWEFGDDVSPRPKAINEV